jgi:hypothetical protein
MKRKLIWRKKIVIGTICLMLLLVTIPTITANNKLGDDFISEFLQRLQVNK